MQHSLAIHQPRVLLTVKYTRIIFTNKTSTIYSNKLMTTNESEDKER